MRSTVGISAVHGGEDVKRYCRPGLVDCILMD